MKYRPVLFCVCDHYTNPTLAILCITFPLKLLRNQIQGMSLHLILKLFVVVRFSFFSLWFNHFVLLFDAKFVWDKNDFFKTKLLAIK